MDEFSPNKTKHATRPPLTNWTHLSDAIFDALNMLMAEAEENVELNGGFKGPVRQRQRPWSRTIDQIEAEREAAA